jgi:hypothetical protein
VRRASGEGFFTGDSENYVKKGSRYGNLSPYGHIWRNVEGIRLSVFFREKDSIKWVRFFIPEDDF